jgi:hypothetical protein
MAFTVEDGTGLTTANAYVSVEFCNTYHSERGHSGWSGSSTSKQRAIVRATDYVDKRFGRRFRGYRTSGDQALEWPRYDAFDEDRQTLSGTYDAVPRQLQKAVAEYALRALALIAGTDADLAPDSGESTGDVIEESVTVGPISESKRYASAQSRAAQSSVVSDSKIPEYPAADLWVEELLIPSSVRRIRRG